MKTLTPQNKFIALDIMKAFAVFFMFLGHIVIMYGTPKVIGSTAITWIAFCAEGIGAPAFIFSMGLAIVLSSPKTPRQICSRGLILIATGYMLNFLKFFPTITLFGTFPEALFAETGRLNDTAGLLSFIFIADILQFAGIAYIFCALLFQYLRNYQIWALLLAIPLLGLAPFLYQEQYAPQNYFLQLFYGQNFQVYFPIFPWLAFPLLGMTAGYFIRNYSNLKRTMLIFLGIGLLLFTIGFLLIKVDPEGQFGSDYYHRKHGALIMYCGQLLTFLSLLSFLSPYLTAGITKGIRFCSRNVTRIYILQWILIYWGWAFTPYNSLPGRLVVPYLILFIALTMLLTAGWEYLSTGKRKKQASEKKEALVKPN